MTIMQRINLAYTIPEWMFQQFTTNGERLCSRNAHDVYFNCEVCGPIEPVACFNGFMRRQCACERAAREKVVSVQKKEISTRCYSWLGQGYAATDLEAMSFENFYPQHQTNAKEYHDHLAKARQYAEDIVQGQQVNNLMLIGSYGTGKTHLAAAICNQLRMHHASCLFCAVGDLFRELYSISFTQQQDLLTQVGSTTLLVLDDLDKLHVSVEKDGEFQKKTLFSILNRRYLKHAPTIITANKIDLSKWLDQATISRLSERLTPMMMNGKDYRQRGKQ